MTDMEAEIRRSFGGNHGLAEAWRSYERDLRANFDALKLEVHKAVLRSTFGVTLTGIVAVTLLGGSMYLGQQLGALTERSRQVQNRLTAVEERLGRIDARVERIDARVERMETHFAGLDARLAEVEKTLQALSNQIGNLQRRGDRGPADRSNEPQSPSLTGNPG